jgi:nucleoside 2-deoxyribosyltransferase
MKKYRLYISGPQRYYPNGLQELIMMKCLAEYYGFEVVNDFSTIKPGLTDYEHIDRIHLDNCDIIVGDVNFFRGGEPESGVMFEMGIAYAKGKRMYSFVRDRRDVIHRYPVGSFGKNGELLDQHGMNYATADTSGNIMYMVPSKIVEGTFEDCLKTIVMDLIEEAKERGQRIIPRKDNRTIATWPAAEGTHRAYLAGFECFMHDRYDVGERMKEACRRYNFEGIYPPDIAPGLGELSEADANDIYTSSAFYFERDQLHIRNSNMVIANFSPFHGHEPDSGTVFEAGMSYGLGYDCYCFTSDGRPLIERISCVKGTDGVYRDIEGYIVENYGFQLSHKLASCMKVVVGDFEAAAKFAAVDLGVYKE